MKGKPRMVTHLNRVLGNELVAINQYFLHAGIYRYWGLGLLADREFRESIDEMKHAERLVERILFLEGIPNLQDLGRLRIGEDTLEMIKADLSLELDAIPDLKEAIAYADSMCDYPSRALLNEILKGEEAYVDWLETQLGLIDRLGIQSYQQAQLS